MIFLVLWLVIVFVGFSMQLVFTGAAVVDHAWFKSLGFREDTVEIAWTHLIVAYFFTAIETIFLFIGVVAYLSRPPGPTPPTTAPRVITSTLFILAAATIIALSAYQRLRRRKLRRREEQRQMAELQKLAEAPAVTHIPIEPLSNEGGE